LFWKSNYLPNFSQQQNNATNIIHLAEQEPEKSQNREIMRVELQKTDDNILIV